MPIYCLPTYLDKNDKFILSDGLYIIALDPTNDGEKEIISCNYWDRWGRFSECIIKSKSGEFEIKLSISPKRLGVLKQKKNGWNLLVSDKDRKYFFNPKITNYDKL